MALVQGIHILAHGDKAEAGRIAIDIQQHQRLLVGVNSVYGVGVYAWYRDHSQAICTIGLKFFLRLIIVISSLFGNVMGHPWAFFGFQGPSGVTYIFTS